jgi:RNA polymerase sigma factor (sigma-70 family)
MSAPAPRDDSLADLAAAAVALHLEGDSAAMPLLVERVTPLLWHVARAQGADAALAEDVVQTTWLRLCQHVEDLTDHQAVLKWLITTAKREAWATTHRQRQANSVDTDDLAQLPDEDAGPEQLAIEGVTSRNLWKHFSQLPRQCQELLRLVAFAARPDYRAVSDALGMPVGSIGPTRGRCLAKLRLALLADPSWEGAR